MIETFQIAHTQYNIFVFVHLIIVFHRISNSSHLLRLLFDQQHSISLDGYTGSAAVYKSRKMLVGTIENVKIYMIKAFNKQLIKPASRIRNSLRLSTTCTDGNKGKQKICPQRYNNGYMQLSLEHIPALLSLLRLYLLYL